jgi:hypothetical protein
VFLHSLRATAVTAAVLTVAWVGVAVGINSQLPSGEEPEDLYAGTSATHWKRTIPVRAQRLNPCTGDVVAIDASLSLDVIAVVEGEDAQVSVTALLSNVGLTTGSTPIVQVREQFGFYAPLYGDPTTVRQLRTQLTGQSMPVEMVVALQHRVGDTDKLIVEPYFLWLNCMADPDELSQSVLPRPIDPPHD